MSSFDDHHRPGESDDADLGPEDHVNALLAQRAVIGLDDDEVRELQAGLADAIADGAGSPHDIDAFDELAAQATLALLPLHDETPPMPASLRERLVADCVRVAHGRPAGTAGDVVRRDPDRAEAFIAESASDPSTSDPAPPAASVPPTPADLRATTPRPAPAPSAPARSNQDRTPGVIATLLPWMGWAAAAAILVFTIMPPAVGPDPLGGPLTAERLNRMADDVVEIQLAGLEGVADGVTGRILWSESRQTGVLRVSGLATNDPGAMQYQLWVFDRGREARNEQNPAVDGGVFNVPPDAGEIEIPIDAKLPVFEPYLFAITSEPPGGVVKHDPELDPDRFRILAAASVPS